MVFIDRYFTPWVIIAQTLDLKSIIKLKYVSSYTSKVAANEMLWKTTTFRKSDFKGISHSLVKAIANVNRIEIDSVTATKADTAFIDTLTATIFPKLTELTISNKTSITKSIKLLEMLKNCPRLRRFVIDKVSINECIKFPDSGIEEITISASSSVEYYSILRLKELKTLKLDALHSTNLSTFSSLLSTYLEYNELRLSSLRIVQSNCEIVDTITRNFLESVSKMKSLDNLDLYLTGNNKLDDLINCINRLPNLRSVAFSYCEGLSNPNNVWKLLDTLKNIDSITFYGKHSSKNIITIDNNVIDRLQSMHHLGAITFKNIFLEYKPVDSRNHFFNFIKNNARLYQFDIKFDKCIDATKTQKQDDSTMFKILLGLPQISTMKQFNFVDLYSQVKSLRDRRYQMVEAKDPFLSIYDSYLARLMKVLRDKMRKTDAINEICKDIFGSDSKVRFENDEDEDEDDDRSDEDLSVHEEDDEDSENEVDEKEEKVNNSYKPRKPSAYQTFMNVEMERVRVANPNLSNTDVMKTAAKRWSKSPEALAASTNAKVKKKIIR